MKCVSSGEVVKSGKLGSGWSGSRIRRFDMELKKKCMVSGRVDKSMKSGTGCFGSGNCREDKTDYQI